MLRTRLATPPEAEVRSRISLIEPRARERSRFFLCASGVWGCGRLGDAGELGKGVDEFFASGGSDRAEGECVEGSAGLDAEDE